MHGGEIYVKKIPSMGICDIAEAISPSGEIQIVGIRPGEKLHEQMIGVEDAPYTYEYPGHYKILPAINGWNEDPLRIHNGSLVDSGFVYSSDNNSEWMQVEELREWINNNQCKIGKI
jgi:FlaA1/EpsC-like NDP-sugar epimerase